MILDEIIFRKNGDILRVFKYREEEGEDGNNFIIVEKNREVILQIETHLAPLVGDCLRHIGAETDFLGLRSHLE